MPSVRSITVLTDRPNGLPQWQDRRVYTHPRAEYRCVFHSPFEFRMGGYAWRLALVSRDSDDVKSGFVPLGETWLGCPGSYAPWSADGRLLLLEELRGLCKPRCLLYDTREKAVVATLHHGVWAAACSPSLPRFAIGHDGTVSLHDLEARCVRTLELEVPISETAEIFWFGDGGSFLVVAPEEYGGVLQFTVFDGASGGPRGALDLDPSALVPYASEAYHLVRDDRYCLLFGHGTAAVGHLLDQWSNIVFDAESNTLTMAIHRPKSPVYESEGCSVCDVEERWVRACISP